MKPWIFGVKTGTAWVLALVTTSDGKKLETYSTWAEACSALEGYHQQGRIQY